MLSYSASLKSILDQATTKADWSSKLQSILGSARRVRCFCDPNNQAADPFATGVEFLNIGASGTLTVSNGNITGLGALSGATIQKAASVSTGKSVLRIEGGGEWVQGTLGLTGSGCDFIMSANPTTSNGYGFSGVTILAPTVLPLAADTVPVGSTLTTITFQNTSTSALSEQLVTFGHVFKVGEYNPANATLSLVGATTLPTQVDVKGTHADGTVRHAIISTVVPAFTASESRTYNIVKVAAGAAPTPAVPSDFASLDAVVSIVSGGLTYSASLATLLAGTTKKTWLAGNVATEWYMRAPLMNNGAAHPIVTARFEVRAYKGKSKARVDVILETTEPPTASGGEHAVYNLSITVGGASVFTRNNVVHLPFTRFRKTFWWGGAAPTVHVRHNTAYLIGTKALPNYDPTLIGATYIPAETSYKTSLDAKRDILQPGVAIPYMPTTGGRDDIGLLPGWDVLYLLGMNPDMRDVCLTQADLMGSWDAHYRDTTTDQPISPIDKSGFALAVKQFTITNITATNPAVVTVAGHKFVPGMSLMPFNVTGTMNVLNYTTYTVGACTANTFELNVDLTGKTFGGAGVIVPTNLNTYEGAHTPAVGYLAYMVSGDHYHLEEMQFYASTGSSNQTMYGKQTRGQAWGLRDVAHAGYLSPDSDRLKGHYNNLLTINFNDYNSKFISTVNNTLGVLTGGSAWSDPDSYGNVTRTWQDDFFTQSLGHIIELGFTQAKPMFDFKSKYVISRMNYCRMLSCPYNIKIRPDNTSAIYSTIQAAYAATFPPDYPQAGNNLLAQVFDSAAMAAQAGGLVGETVVANSIAGYADSPTGYVANMQPALAMVATLGSTGGAAAWTRYDGRAMKQNYNGNPQFAIVPRS